MELSGPQWVSRFPTSASVDDLIEPFRSNVARFIKALRDAHASVAIADTFRPPERTYLMHFAFVIARGLDPQTVSPMAGVDIQWVHVGPDGKPDLAASKQAAARMAQGYGIRFEPALTSRHTERNAIDMTITWSGDLTIARADGTSTIINSAPRTGDNTSLHAVGATFGVIKLVRDPPHWSSDGH